MGYPTLDDIKAYLGVTDDTDDAYLQGALDAVINAVEDYCQRKLDFGSEVQTHYDATYENHFYMSRFPVISVSKVMVGENQLDSSAYKFAPPTGILMLNSPMSGDVEIHYAGGYRKMPPIITYTINESVKTLYTNKDTNSAAGAIKSERVDGVATIAYYGEESSGASSDGAGNASPLISNLAYNLDPYMSEKAIGSAF